NYLQEKDRLLQKYFPNGRGISMDLIWDGGQENNQNAALTIFRHFDSATVEKGFIGDNPKTAWLVGYPLLERVHYLLVAGFDIYGNLGHQLVTRLYMDFLRMEGEYNFLQFLPEEPAEKELELWYQNSENQVAAYVQSMRSIEGQGPDISYLTDNPKQELFEKLSDKLGNSLITRGAASRDNQGPLNEDLLYSLRHTKGIPVSQLAEVSLLRVSSNSGADKVYSLIANRAHKNVSHLFGEADRIIIAEQTLTVVEGILGDYPNAFFHIHESQLAQFIESLNLLQTEEDYGNFLDRFAVRRNSDQFWAFSDWLNEYLHKSKPIEAGIL
ncbi:MAG: 9-hexadecenoic acid cis-trans isomerase, partial [Candidatus Brocadiaceae bacterium]|nr:9-hexadecenoic acid cis-trans isomerase [Candidatus Brocadiaceae bacterium]